MLLGLDRTGPPELPQHIIDALQRYTGNNSGNSTGIDHNNTNSTTGASASVSANPLLASTCWCGQVVNISTEDSVSVRLPCSHVAHEICVKSLVTSVISDRKYNCFDVVEYVTLVAYL